jgi:hypothetical protein
MNWFAKKPVVEFASCVEGLEKIMPIIPARKVKHPWLIRAFHEYARLKKQPGYDESKNKHITNCPGILAIMHHGWVLRSWQDMIIETEEDGISYKWQTPFNEESAFGITSVHVHSPNELIDFFEYWDSPTKYIFKLNTAWHFKIPKGYALLTMPVAYADEDRFETVPGITTYEYGWMPLNPQIKWKASAGRTLIKAGTPLAQFMLIKMEETETKVYYKPDLIKKIRLREMFINSRFTKTARQVKDFFRGTHE